MYFALLMLTIDPISKLYFYHWYFILFFSSRFLRKWSWTLIQRKNVFLYALVKKTAYVIFLENLRHSVLWTRFFYTSATLSCRTMLGCPSSVNIFRGNKLPFTITTTSFLINSIAEIPPRKSDPRSPSQDLSDFTLCGQSTRKSQTRRKILIIVHFSKEGTFRFQNTKKSKDTSPP